MLLNIPVVAMFEGWASIGLIVKTLPRPLLIGTTGCGSPVFCCDVYTWPLPLDSFTCMDG